MYIIDLSLENLNDETYQYQSLMSTNLAFNILSYVCSILDGLNFIISLNSKYMISENMNANTNNMYVPKNRIKYPATSGTIAIPPAPIKVIKAVFEAVSL